jgi:hypothetical protein
MGEEEESYTSGWEILLETRRDESLHESRNACDRSIH